MPEQVYWVKKIGNKIEKVLFDPINFFKRYKTENFTEILVYYCTLALIPALLTPLSTAAFPMLMKAITIPLPTAYLTFALMVYTLSIFGILITSAVYHALIWIVGGRKGIIKTFAAVVYASTPSLILGWIPMIGIIVSLWSLILTIVGLSKLHKISYWRSGFAVILLPLIIFFALFLLIFWPLIF